MIRKRHKSKNQKTVRSELIRMLVSTCMITMLVVGIVLSVLIFRWSAIKAREDMEFYMESVQQQFSDKLLFLEESVTYLSVNDEIDSFFLHNEGTEENLQKVLEQGVNLFSSRNLIGETFPVVKDYYIFNKEMGFVSTHFYPETQTAITQTNVRLVDGIKRYQKQDQMFYYRKNGKEVECYFSIYDDQLERKGYCVAILDMNSIAKIFSQLSKYETYYWGIVSDEPEIIGGEQLKGIALDDLEKHEGTIDHQKIKYLYRMKHHSFGLSAYVLIPESKLYLNIFPQFQMAWIISLSMVIAVVAAIILYSIRFTKPLQNIVEKIEQVGEGDFEAKLGNYNIAEFQQISDAFNEMTQKMVHLIKEVYETQLLVKEARLKYLQAQINPHFMFNVLTMIAIRVKRHKDDELYHMVTSFAGLMQGKLFRKNEVEIPLEEEMKIVGFYLYLQGERFKDIITYDILWESEDLKKCFVPRLCIEPFVENAVIHGLEKKDSEGKIQITISQSEADMLKIVVEDDGVGFDVSHIDEKTDNKNPRVGIMNIQRLIHNLYGEKYGIQVNSEINKGTKVEVYLPVKTEKMI